MQLSRTSSVIRTRIKTQSATHVACRRAADACGVGGVVKGSFGQRFVGLMFVGLTFAIVSCSSGDAGCAGSETRGSVAVASSLTEWIGVFAEEFDLTQRVSIAGSQTLRLQIENGARPDVFISANQEHADAVARLKEYGDVAPFVCNEVALAYAKSSFNEAPDMLSAMTTSERVAIAEAAVPAGRYGLELLRRLAEESPDIDVAAVLRKVVSYDLNVRQVLMRLVRGEADIGFVYASDILQARESVGRVELPTDLAPEARYFIAHLKTPRADRLAQAMQTETSMRLAEGLGFAPCSETSYDDELLPQ